MARCLSWLISSFIFLSLTIQAQDIPNIAAAANVRFALADIQQAFTQKTGLTVNISYGSSGQLVQQIRHGAPFQLFLSADQDYAKQLVDLGLTKQAPTVYAMGRLALVKAKSSNLILDPTLKQLAIELTKSRIERFAIASPEHAPYGLAAKQALQTSGLWQRIKPKLVYGENVAQAAQFALSQSAQGGIIALSLAKSSNFTQQGEFVAIDAKLHQPLKQAMVLTKQSGRTALSFYQFMQSKTAQRILVDYGFDLPNSTSH
ncbi:MAG: molybdate ABC transporter substrate-binding protein [Parashewanella sp.]